MKQHKFITYLKSEKLFLTSVYIFVFIYTLSPFLTSASFVLFCALSLFHIKKPYLDKVNLLWLGLLSFLFFLYFIGIWFTPFMERALKLMLRISPILFVPLIIGLTRLNAIVDYEKLKNSFVFGVIISCSISILVALGKFMAIKEISVFFYYQLGNILHIHPTYYALFIIIAIHFLTISHSKFLNKYKIVIYILLYLFIYLLQSKTGFITVLSYSLYKLIDNYKNKEPFKAILLPLVLIVLVAALGYQNNRFKELFIERDAIEIGNFEEDGVSQRAWLWNEALTQLKQKPIVGYGLGAQYSVFGNIAKKEILKKNLTFNYAEAVRTIAELNLHNQYMQIVYEFGILGLLVYLLSIIILFTEAIRCRNTSFLVIQCILIFFLMTENLLDRQMGVYLYSFILPILFFEKNPYVHNKKDIESS